MVLKNVSARLHTYYYYSVGMSNLNIILSFAENGHLTRKNEEACWWLGGLLTTRRTAEDDEGCWRREGLLTATRAADDKDGGRGKRPAVQQGPVGVHMRVRFPTRQHRIPVGLCQGGRVHASASQARRRRGRHSGRRGQQATSTGRSVAERPDQRWPVDPEKGTGGRGRGSPARSASQRQQVERPQWLQRPKAPRVFAPR